MKTTHARLLGSTMLCSAALLAAAPVLAQTADGASEVTEVVVTGSRIPQPNLTSISPVQVVSQQEVTLGGRPVTADFLNQLPQVAINSQTGLGSTSNPLSGPGGIATVDLRGLGLSRTLVLVDGRRLGVGDPNTGNPNPSPDINQIPSQLIDRVEVLTGGASATYGSDAVAGVINFVMKRNFEGVQMDAQFGVNQHHNHNDMMQGLEQQAGVPLPKSNTWDGESRDFSLIFGANAPDARGNVTGYITYHDQDPVQFSARDWAACQLNVDPTARCAGSSNSNIFYQTDGSGPTLSVLGNQFVPWGTAGTNPPAVYNANALEYLIQHSTRWTAGFFSDYEVSDHLKLYSDLSYMDDRTNVQIAPAGLFQGTGATADGGFLVNCNNPFLSPQQQSAMLCTPQQVRDGASKDLYIGRRNVEGGGRMQSFEHQNFRVVFGGKGQIAGPWNYDLYGSYYYTTLYQASDNYLSVSRVQNALQVVQGPNGPVCISGGACVPYNIFQDGGVTPEALAYIDASGTSRGSVSERIIEGTINGDLGAYGVKSPWAREGVGVALGFQQRRDHLDYAPDSSEESGDLSGLGGASTRIDNSLRAAEVYGEARVPLVQDMPWVRDLSFEGGYRYSDYSTGIQAKTYKVGLQWAPTPDVRFRASFNKAIRAPSILDLYTPLAVTNSQQLTEDPCAAGAASPATLQQCERTGITPAQYGTIANCPGNQCAVLVGGNAALQPERAKTYSVGFTFTPSFVPGLTASVDWYRVALKNTIGALSSDLVMQRCLTEGQYCDMIHRQTNGTLFGSTVGGGGYIDGTSVNIGAGVTSGVDVQAHYNLPLEAFGWDSWGRVSVDLNGAYSLETTTVPTPGDPAYDCAGLYGKTCGALDPRWRHMLRVTWNSPWNVTVSGAWRYFGGVKLETDTNEPGIGKGTTDPFNHTLPAVSYFDLSATWKITPTYALRAGVNNLFDKDPPVVNSAITGSGLPNAYPTYDYLGRHLFIGFTADF